MSDRSESIIQFVYNDGSTMTFDHVCEWNTWTSEVWPHVTIGIALDNGMREHMISLENVRRVTVEPQR